MFSCLLIVVSDSAVTGRTFYRFGCKMLLRGLMVVGNVFSLTIPADVLCRPT